MTTGKSFWSRLKRKLFPPKPPKPGDLVLLGRLPGKATYRLWDARGVPAYVNVSEESGDHEHPVMPPCPQCATPLAMTAVTRAESRAIMPPETWPKDTLTQEWRCPACGWREPRCQQCGRAMGLELGVPADPICQVCRNENALKGTG